MSTYTPVVRLALQLIRLISCTWYVWRWVGGVVGRRRIATGMASSGNFILFLFIIMWASWAANMSYHTFSRSKWKLQAQLLSPWCPATFLEHCSYHVAFPYDLYWFRFLFFLYSAVRSFLGMLDVQTPVLTVGQASQVGLFLSCQKHSTIIWLSCCATPTG